MKNALIERILVTGGAGFIGSHLCERLLLDGYQVMSIDNFNDFYDPRMKRENIELIQECCRNRFISLEADIRDQIEIHRAIEEFRPQLVVHLAAMAGVRPSIQNPALYLDVNVGGTQTLLDACVENKIRYFVFASSSSVYGNNQKVPFSETDQVDVPISPYAATKKSGELLCHVYSHLHQMNISCLRFFTVYGPRQRPDLAIHKFSLLMKDGKEIPFFGDGLTRRDYTYIDDIIDGVVKAIDWTTDERHSAKYDLFNLGGSRTITLKELVACLERALGVKAKIRALPPEKGDVVCTYADISKARQMIGYEPSTEFEEGISKFIQWFQRKNLAHV